MPNFDRAHVMIQWGGALPGNEIWSNSLRASSSGTGDGAYVPAPEDMQAWLEGPLQTAVAAFHQRPGTHVSGLATLTFVKANAVNTTGHYIEPVTLEYVYPSPLPGGGSGNQMPNQVTLVVSTTTGLSRGPAHRGRFYLPLPAVQLGGADGRIQLQNAVDVANSAAQFVMEVADTPGLDLLQPLKAVVMSRKVGAPATHVITGVEVGRVLDTQRRRRSELPEDYQSAPADQGAW